MTDFQKNITVVLFGALLSVAGTFAANVLVIGERITSVDKAVVKLGDQIEKLDSKQREMELAQVRMLALNR